MTSQMADGVLVVPALMADGTWQRMHDQLREDLRAAAGREETPSAAIVDSQSVKTTEKGGRAAGR